MNNKAVKIDANFSDLNNPETITKHFDELKNLKHLSTEDNPFPYEVFPDAIQDIIKSTNETLLFPIDFIGASILYAISVATGNTHAVEVKKGWRETGVLYLSIVGKAGTNKSHPISFGLSPIENKDSAKFKEYQAKNQEFEMIKSLSKKEREEQNYEEPIKPFWEQHLVTDFTPEALTDIHKANLRGIGVYVDELASWFKNFNRYNKGSEEQFWLSVWSGKPIRINRKTTEPTYLQLPFISVIGTIQPGVLSELANNRTENGFLDRLLFVIPDKLKKEYWNEAELSENISDNWNVINAKLLELKMLQDQMGSVQPEVLKFSPEARQIIVDYQRQLTDKSNNASEETAGIYAKIEMYSIRLSLLLEMSYFACGESDKRQIGVKAAKGAIKLCEYFFNTALKVHSIVNADAFEKLPKDKQDVYNGLPDFFTTGEGVKIAEGFRMSERTFKRFITDKELFNCTSHGEYYKKL